MVQKLKLVFLFYRKFLISSVLVNLFLLFIGIALPVSIAIKFLIFGWLIIIYLTTKVRDKLTFYHNLSISTIYLFVATFLFDLLLLIITYLLLANVY